MPVCCRIYSPWFIRSKHGEFTCAELLGTDAGRPLYFQRPRNIGNPLHAIFKAPALQPVDNLVAQEVYTIAGPPPLCRCTQPVFYGFCVVDLEPRWENPLSILFLKQLGGSE